MMVEDSQEQQVLECKHFGNVMSSFKNYRNLHTLALNLKISSLKDDNRLSPMRERLQNHIHAINCNAFFLLRVINTPPIFSHEILVNDQNHQATHLDNTKVVSVLRQFVREWAAEGSVEKEKSNDLILNALQTLFPEPETRSNLTILVPGCGLGRLVYEIAHLGFSCEGNELSYHMLLASNFILNHSSESGPIEIYPWIHSLNNTISSATQLAKITIPSKPLKSPLTKMSMIAGDFASIYHKDTHSFPCIVTQYFIDTQPNLLDLISQLHSLIPSGKYWINIGPLEYHFENLEFTQNEVRVLIQNQGFEIMIEDFNQESYTADFESMRKDLYNCWFFVARKI